MDSSKLKQKLIHALSFTLIIAFTLCCISVIVLLITYRQANIYYQDRYLQTNLTSAESIHTTKRLRNPYQGFYTIHGYRLSSDISDEELTKRLESDYKHHKSDPLTLVEINLSDYQDKDLDAAALAQLDEILTFWEKKQFQIILRPLYDWNGKASETEPHSVEQIEAHMDEIAPVINKHKQYVYTLQGIFVGDFAEMHGSVYMEQDTMIRLAKHLADVINPDIYLAVRTPAHRRIILDSMTADLADTAHDGSLAARLGLFNDGMLGSGSDLGTYGEIPAAEAKLPSDKLTREDEIAYQNILCQYVPNGGEVTLDNPYNDIDNAVTDLKAMHVSYLNSEHHMPVLDKWKNSTIRTDDVWDNTNGYKYIQAHLGYRFSYESITSAAFDFWTDDTLQLQITFSNLGFSNSYMPMQPSLTLTDSTGNVLSDNITSNNIITDDYASAKSDASCDFRNLSPNNSLTIPLCINIRELPDDSYHLYFKLTDTATGKEILLDNELTHAKPGYEIGSISRSSVPTNNAPVQEIFSHFVSYLMQN